MDDLIYRTSTVAYDTCLADRPQTQDDVKQELSDPTPRKYRFRPRDRYRPGIRLTPGPGVKDEDEPDFAGSAEDELGSDGSSRDEDEKSDDHDEPMGDDEEEIPPPPPPPPAPPAPPVPVEPETPVVSHVGISSGDAVLLLLLLPLPLQQTLRLLRIHLRTRTWPSILVSLTPSPSWRAGPTSPRPGGHLVVGSPRPRKGRGVSRSHLAGGPALRAWPSLLVHPRSPREAVWKVGREGAGPRVSTPRRTLSLARKQLPVFVFDRAVPVPTTGRHRFLGRPWRL